MAPNSPEKKYTENALFFRISASFGEVNEQSSVEFNEVKVSQKVLSTGCGTLFLHKLAQVPAISFTTVSLFVSALKCQV